MVYFAFMAKKPDRLRLTGYINICVAQIYPHAVAKIPTGRLEGVVPTDDMEHVINCIQKDRSQCG